jgi:hypothetical protein
LNNLPVLNNSSWEKSLPFKTFSITFLEEDRYVSIEKETKTKRTKTTRIN